MRCAYPPYLFLRHDFWQWAEYFANPTLRINPLQPTNQKKERQMIRIQKLAMACMAMALSLGVGASIAAPVNYNFNGAVDFGALLGETYSGQFTFDDAALTGSGDEYLPVSSLSFNFLGNAFDQSNGVAPPEAAFLDGAFLGLSFNVDAFNPGFATIPGFVDVSESYFAYDNGAGSAGFGSLAYSVSAVPEAETWTMLLPGLVLLGFFARRRGKI
jgi:hypothetical protein